MSDNPLSGKVGLDVTDYKAGVVELNRQLRVIESGFRASVATMSDWDKTSEGLTLRARALGQQVDLQKQKVAALTAVYVAIVAAKGADSRAAQELQIKINRQNEALGKMQSELTRSEAALSEVGSESGATSKKVEDLGNKEVDTAEKTGRFKSSIHGLGAVLKIGVTAAAGLATAVAGIGTAVGAMILKTASSSAELVDMSAKTDISIERLQELSYAGDQVGTNLDTITASMSKLVRSMDSAQGGTGDAADAFKYLGVSVTDASGNLRSNQDVFNEVVDSLGKVDNATQRDALGMAIFGKSAQELNPLIKAGSEEIRRLSQEAREMGAVMSESDVESMEAFDDSLSSLKAGLKGTLGTMVTAFLPGIQSLATKGGGYLKQFSSIAKGSSGDLGQIAKGVGSLIGQIVSDIAAKVPVLMQTGLMIIQSIVTAIVQNLPMLISAAVLMLTSLINFIVQNLPMLITVALQLIITLANGISQSLPVLIPAIVAIIPQIVTTLIENIPLLLTAAAQLIIGLAQGLVAAIPVLIPEIPKIVTAIFNALVASVPILAGAAVELVTALAMGLSTNFPLLVSSGKDAINALVEGVKSLWSTITSVGSSIVTGVWEGIQSNYGVFLENVKGFFSGVVSEAKKLLGISSPSRVFAEIGKNMALGIGVGFAGQMNAIKKNINASFGGLTLVAAGVSNGNSVSSQNMQQSNVQNFYAPVINQYGSANTSQSQAKRW